MKSCYIKKLWARRFEIPRDELNAIKDIADQGDRLAALEEVLAKFGVTQELIAASAGTTAVQYDKLAGAATDAKAAIGELLAAGLQPAAKELTSVFQTISGSLNVLRESGTKKLGIEAGFILAAQSADQFNLKIQAVNAAVQENFSKTNTGIISIIPGINTVADAMDKLALSKGTFDQLSQAEFVFAQNALQAGISLDTIKAAIITMKPAFSDLESTILQLPDRIAATRQEIDNFKQAALGMASSGKDGAIGAQAITNAVINGDEPIQAATIRMQDYTFALAENAARQQELANANAFAAQGQADVAAQTIAANAAISAQAVEAANAAIESENLKIRQEEIVAAANAAALGLDTSGNAALAMGNKFNIAAAEAQGLIDKLRNLSIAKNLAGANTPGEQQFVGANALAGRSVDLEAFRRAQKTLDGVNDALRDQNFALANSAGQVKILQGELAKLAPGTEPYIRKQTEIAKAESALAKKRTAGGAARLSANDKLHNKLAAQEDKFNNQIEDAERKHQQNLLKILQDAAKKQLETEKENEILKRRSRFDFYNNLNKSSIAPIDKQKFAAAYEQAFAEAQAIAQSGRAKLAQEFLELRKSQIEELQELAQESQDIKADDDLSKDEKNARLKELEERKKLLLDAQEEERKQLLEGGDKNRNEVNDRIAEENKAFDDQTDKIALNADRAADAKINAAERSKIKVTEENKAYADQIALLDTIAEKNGGKPTGAANAVGSNVPVNPAGQVATPVTAVQPIPVKADVPLQVQTPETITVKQFELLLVRDQGVIDTLGDQTIRLENKFIDLITAVNSLGVILGPKIDQVKNAISSSKFAKP